MKEYGGEVFQPTPSLRRATVAELRPGEVVVISTHALLAEGDQLLSMSSPEVMISTHALLAEGDSKVEQWYHLTYVQYCHIHIPF